MAKLRVELGEENPGFPCRSCGSLAHLVYGLVFLEESAHAIYLAGYCEAQAGDGVSLSVSIGDFSESGGPHDRTAIWFSALMKSGRVEFLVLEPDRAPFSTLDYLGPSLSRDEGVAHPQLPAFLRVARAATRSDPRVRKFLKTTAA